MPRNLHEKERAEIVTLWMSGYRKSEIAEELKVSRTTVDKWINKFEAEGNVNNRPRPPKKLKIGEVGLAEIREAYSKDPSTPAKELAKLLNCSANTIRRARQKAGVQCEKVKKVRMPRKARCAVLGCRYNVAMYKKLKNITMFAVPNDERRKAWLKAIKPVDPTLTNLSVCQLHFAAEDITNNQKRKRVVWGAAPTLLLPKPDVEEPTARSKEHASDDEDLERPEVKSEPEDNILVDLFTEEETVVQKRSLEDIGLSEVPIKKERLDDSTSCEAEKNVEEEMQTSYRYDTSFPRPVQVQDDITVSKVEPGSSHGEDTEYESATLNDTEFESAISNHTDLESATLNHTELESATTNHTELESATSNHTELDSATSNHTELHSATSNDTELDSATSNHTELDSATSNVTAPQPAKRNVKELDLLVKLSKTYLSPEMAKFVRVQAQMKNDLKTAFENKLYSKDMLHFALNLYHSYPQTYKIIQESFYLPPILTIKQLCRNLSWELNESWMAVLRARFERASSTERECVLCVAKVRLSLRLAYDPVRDRMAGLDEIGGSQRPRMARYAIVVYARGIFGHWRQPLSYALLPESFRPVELWRWFEDLVSKLFDVGLNVRAVVTDFDDDYNPIIRPLSSGKTYFQLQDKQIYCFYDCTQLMVKLRDCFRNYNINFKGMTAEWDVIEDLFEYDSSRRYKLGAGLTEEHVKPVGKGTRQTQLAVETLSPKVASALAAAVDIRVLDDSAHGTIQFITAFSTLYDILHNKEIAVLEKGIPAELKFLHEMMMQFERITFLNKETMRNIPRPGVVGAFSNNVRAAMALQERMRRAGYKGLPLRAFNNDPLYEFLNRVGVLNGKKGPTGWQLINGFRKSFVINIMKSFSKEGKLDGFLDAASKIKNIAVKGGEAPVFRGVVKPSHVAPLTRVSMGSQILLAQCMRQKPCCELGRQFCRRPPTVFSEYLCNMERKFRMHFAPEKLSEGVMASILASLDKYEFPSPCSCFPDLYVKMLYLRFRVANLTEYNNAKFRRGISRDFTMNISINSY